MRLIHCRINGKLPRGTLDLLCFWPLPLLEIIIMCCYQTCLIPCVHQVSKDSARRGAKPQQYKKRPNPYKNQLMLSEWLVDVPEDFE